jgi:hypothetical protein
LSLHRLFLLLLLLAACGGPRPLEAVSATPDEVAFAYGDGRGDDAAHQAALYCANLGRSATLRAQTPTPQSRTLAVFECR